MGGHWGKEGFSREGEHEVGWEGESIVVEWEESPRKREYKKATWKLNTL